MKKYILKVMGITAMLNSQRKLFERVGALEIRAVADDYLAMTKLGKEFYRKRKMFDYEHLSKLREELERRGLDIWGENPKPKKTWVEYWLENDNKKKIEENQARIDAQWVKAMTLESISRERYRFNMIRQREPVILNGHQYSGETVCLAERQKELQNYTADELAQAYSTKLKKQAKEFVDSIPPIPEGPDVPVFEIPEPPKFTLPKKRILKVEFSQSPPRFTTIIYPNGNVCNWPPPLHAGEHWGFIKKVIKVSNPEETHISDTREGRALWIHLIQEGYNNAYIVDSDGAIFP